MESLKFWKPETFDIASFKWHLKERVNKEILGNGSDIGSCYYTFNELGFRGDSPKKKGTRIMSVGCSHTEGHTVDWKKTWPHLFMRNIVNENKYESKPKKIKNKNLIIKSIKPENQYENVFFYYGDGFLGLPTLAPFDKIIITAAAPNVPEKLWEQLKVNGIMVIPVDETPERAGFEFTKSGMPKIHGITPFRRDSPLVSDEA
jgi:hypothetical protein